ncbi:DUF6735 family protein [Halosimplex pelagicum]|uniref:Uncharacterized protein n=1 Tax=Halosimplex pelagicum TaxID=869886 RepID=A0A7D5TCU8_9EURY|nr:DUF6735 family protein [Halosimplex pelagicum]QLH84930.1 hypothetical protein HZS54_06960 [Halosimplex pelagicum]
MGHRALIAYERPDSTYNCHYSHWGAMHLRLKNDIAKETPFGRERPDERLQSLFEELCEAETDSDLDALLNGVEYPNQPVDVDPWDIGCTLESIIADRLDFLHHEAFYVVDSDFQVTAYRTHWFGLQYDSALVDESPTIGNGALRTVRWYDGEPVGDGFAQGEFRALKDITGELIDQGVLTRMEAPVYLERKLDEWVGEDQELIVRTVAFVDR